MDFIKLLLLLPMTCDSIHPSRRKNMPTGSKLKKEMRGEVLFKTQCCVYLTSIIKTAAP